jgi:hypothetical protein
MLRLILLLIMGALFLQNSACAATLGLNDKGITVDGGTMGKFTLEYPELHLKDGKTVKVVEPNLAGKKAILKYANGGQLEVTLQEDGKVHFKFSGLGDEVKSWKSLMFIGMEYIQGGKWKIGDNEAKPFPANKTPGGHFFQANNAGTLTITSFDGKNISFTPPPFSYGQMTDNREWNWAAFVWAFFAPFNKNDPQATITIKAGVAVSGQTTLVDEFGQLSAGDWPGKVKSAEEFKGDVESEKAYYAALKTPTLDKFGGLPGGREKYGLRATGFFHVEQKNGKWVLVNPEGNPFFHTGVCVFNPVDDYTLVKGRESSFAWIPPYEGHYKSAFRGENGSDVVSFHLANMVRKYNEPFELERYQARMIERVKKFGFNSIGAFSSATQAAHRANFPYVTSLPLDQWNGGIPRLPGIHEAWDPFDEKIRARVEENFAKSVAAKANDPLLIGYFLVNEPLYEDLPKVVPTLKGTHAVKRRLVQMLREKYPTIAAFNTAWETIFKNFDELNDAHLIVKTRTASEDMHAFSGVYFEAYFKLVADTFRKYDKNHMLIGNRLQPGTANNEQLCRIMGKYMDVFSLNYYTNAVDKDFLTRLHNWSGGKPMMLSEFYWTAPAQSGLVGGLDVSTQQERGLAYRNYIEQTAALGFVVGIEWFTLVDQATTGRWFSGFSGERANSGLFSVADRPWKPMLEEMAKSNFGIYDVWLDGKAPFAWDDPRFAPKGGAIRSAQVPRATGPITIDGTNKNWPGVPPEQITGKRLVMGSTDGGMEATFRLCWDEKNLYFMTNVIDPTPMQNKQTGNALWNGDGVELFIGSEKVGTGGPFLFTDRQILLSAGKREGGSYIANAPQQTPIEMIVVPGGDGKSYTLQAAIPWTILNVQPKAGQELMFDLAIDDSPNGNMRVRQLMWSGTAKNSSDRSHWGRLKLIP